MLGIQFIQAKINILFECVCCGDDVCVWSEWKNAGKIDAM